jgi:hypothetical protein
MIAWITIKTFLKKVTAWCKKYWQILVGAAIPVVIWILTQKSDDLEKILDKSKESHEKELAVIEEAHQLELNKRDDALKRYQSAMLQVETMFKSSSIALSKSKRKAVEKAIKENKEDPDAITKKIAALTGFKVHVK